MRIKSCNRRGFNYKGDFCVVPFHLSYVDNCLILFCPLFDAASKDSCAQIFFVTSQFGKGWPSGIFSTCFCILYVCHRNNRNNSIISSFLRKQHISHVGTKAEIPRARGHTVRRVFVVSLSLVKGDFYPSFSRSSQTRRWKEKERTDIDRSDHDRIPMQTQLEAVQQVVTQQQHGIIEYTSHLHMAFPQIF